MTVALAARSTSNRSLEAALGRRQHLSYEVVKVER